jgi:hypothetical protein
MTNSSYPSGTQRVYGWILFFNAHKRATRSLLLLALTVIATAEHAQALGIPGLGWGYTTGYGIAKGTGINPPGYTGLTTWSIWWDPPASAIRGQVTFSYDPSLITVLPQYSGFVGLFSNDPSSGYPVNPSETYPAYDVTTLPGPRAGMVSNLNVSANTVSLFWDDSANPVTVDQSTGSLNFFLLTVQTSIPLSGWTVNDTNTGQFHEVGSLNDQSQTYMICSDPTRGAYSCGETTSSTRGFGLTAIAPEPSSAAMLLCSGFCAALVIFYRRRIALPRPTETIPGVLLTSSSETPK